MIIQGLLVSTSSVVRTALEERLTPAQFVVVTPHHWTEENCQVELKEPRGQTRYKVSTQSIESVCCASMSQCHTLLLFQDDYQHIFAGT